MRNLFFAIGLSLFGTVLAAPAAADNDTPDKPAAEDAPINATPALWVVHGPKGTAYLLGSIHALPKNVNWQTPAITAAMKRADVFAFEVPMDEESRSNARMLIQKDSLLPIDLSLPSFFDQEMRDDYRHVIFQIHGDPEGIVYLRPWVAAMVLQGQSEGAGPKGLLPEEGVDNKVYAAAQARGVKDFRAMETHALQIHILTDDGNLEEGLAALRLTFKKLLAEHQDQTSGQRLFTAWYKGDVKGLAAVGPDNPEMSPAWRKKLLEDRNTAWVPEIIAMLNEKHTYFITVGAAHLVGKIGVPNLLRAKGYKVDGPPGEFANDAPTLRPLTSAAVRH
jgi:uncharacterized protein YbaP (TraB family)